MAKKNKTTMEGHFREKLNEKLLCVAVGLRSLESIFKIRKIANLPNYGLDPARLATARMHLETVGKKLESEVVDG